MPTLEYLATIKQLRAEIAELKSTIKGLHEGGHDYASIDVQAQLTAKDERIAELEKIIELNDQIITTQESTIAIGDVVHTVDDARDKIAELKQMVKEVADYSEQISVDTQLATGEKLAPDDIFTGDDDGQTCVTGEKEPATVRTMLAEYVNRLDEETGLTGLELGDIKEIAEEYLDDNNLTGLREPNGECGCEVSDLMPCSDSVLGCQAGYRVSCIPKSDTDDCCTGCGFDNSDFHISLTKPSAPTDDVATDKGGDDE